MLKYIGCFVIISAMAFLGKCIGASVGKRIDTVKFNLDKLKKSASDYEVFGMNINCETLKCENLRQEDIEFFDKACQIKDIAQLNDLILKTEEHYCLVKEKNEWIRKNSIILSVLTGIAIITLLY